MPCPTHLLERADAVCHCWLEILSDDDQQSGEDDESLEHSTCQPLLANELCAGIVDLTVRRITKWEGQLGDECSDGDRSLDVISVKSGGRQAATHRSV